MAKPILVGYDAGRGDRAPLEFGLAVANVTRARVIVAAGHSSVAGFGGVGAGVVEKELEEGPGESLDQLAKERRERGINVEWRSLPGTSAARALHEAAEEFGAGLLVVGSTERGGSDGCCPVRPPSASCTAGPARSRSSHTPGSEAPGCARSAWGTSTRPKATTRSTTRSRTAASVDGVVRLVSEIKPR